MNEIQRSSIVIGNYYGRNNSLLLRRKYFTIFFYPNSTVSSRTVSSTCFTFSICLESSKDRRPLLWRQTTSENNASRKEWKWINLIASSVEHQRSSDSDKIYEYQFFMSNLLIFSLFIINMNNSKLQFVENTFIFAF